MSIESDETSDQLPDLDWKSQEILRALHENDGAANTSEIRTLTGIDNNDQILYRFREKLAPSGLITLEQPESDTARPEPKVATFTQRGVEVAERIIERRGETTSIGDAVEEFDARVTRIESQIDQLKTDSDDTDGPSPSDLQAQIDDLDKNLQALYRNMSRFRDYLNKRDDGGYSEFVEEQEGNTET